MAISFERTVSDQLNLTLPIQRDFLPLPDGRLSNPERAGQGSLAPKKLDGVCFLHDVISMAWYTSQGKDTRHESSYAHGMASYTDITSRITQTMEEMGYTPSALARAVGVTRQTVGDWIKGRTI